MAELLTVQGGLTKLCPNLKHVPGFRLLSLPYAKQWNHHPYHLFAQLNPLANCPFRLGSSCRRNAEPAVEAQPQPYAATSCGAICPLAGSMRVSRSDSISHRQIEDLTV